eukprot:TRINITY_DN8927_c0_g1_i1.p1 TRINITY_DN8927_c0_g1~~TRINITY_DN8927_c0_g1_i1.p1  ORF type:complete len:789 (+),score=228.06 TRINITY_DN8927_c0_g1_i1:81-2369(+)
MPPSSLIRAGRAAAAGTFSPSSSASASEEPSLDGAVAATSASTGDSLRFQCGPYRVALSTGGAPPVELRSIIFYPSVVRLEFPERGQCHRLLWEEAEGVLRALLRLCERCSGTELRLAEDLWAGRCEGPLRLPWLQDWLRAVAHAPRPTRPAARGGGALGPPPTLQAVGQHVASVARRVVVLCGPPPGGDLRGRCAEQFAELRQRGLPAPHSLYDASYFRERPDLFYAALEALCPPEEPPGAAAHLAAELCSRGVVRRVYSLSTDGRELRAGVDPQLLVECDGSHTAAVCSTCGTAAAPAAVREAAAARRRPRCKCGGGLLRPALRFACDRTAVVSATASARADFEQCDLLLVLGTAAGAPQWGDLLSLVPRGVPRLQIGPDPHSPLLRWDEPGNDSDLHLSWPADDGIAALAAAAGVGGALAARCRRTGAPLPPPPSRAVRGDRPAVAAAEALIRAAGCCKGGGGPAVAVLVPAAGTHALCREAAEQLCAVLCRAAEDAAALYPSGNCATALTEWHYRAVRTGMPHVVIEVCDVATAPRLRREIDEAVLSVPSALLLRAGRCADRAPDGHIALCQPAAQALRELLAQARRAVEPSPLPNQDAAEYQADGALPSPQRGSRTPTRPDTFSSPGTPTSSGGDAAEAPPAPAGAARSAAAELASTARRRSRPDAAPAGGHPRRADLGPRVAPPAGRAGSFRRTASGPVRGDAAATGAAAALAATDGGRLRRRRTQGPASAKVASQPCPPVSIPLKQIQCRLHGTV